MEKEVAGRRRRRWRPEDLVFDAKRLQRVESDGERCRGMRQLGDVRIHKHRHQLQSENSIILLISWRKFKFRERRRKWCLGAKIAEIVADLSSDALAVANERIHIGREEGRGGRTRVVPNVGGGHLEGIVVGGRR